MANNPKEKIVIFDSDALLYRAYYALPPLKTVNGELVNAVYGFLLVFLKALREIQPHFIAAVFDSPSPTFRHKRFKGYKAKRMKMPDDLRQQLPKIKEILKKMDVPIFEKEGFEADDIIGAIAKAEKTIESGIDVIIVSGDKDMFSLIGEKVKVYFLGRGIKEAIIYDKKAIIEKYLGLEPEQLLDFKALRGDPSDNIPGVRGVGEKTAISLVNKLGSIENLYAELKKNSPKAQEIKLSLKEKLLSQEKEAFLSKFLVEIKINILPNFNFEVCRWNGYNKEKVRDIFEKYQFKTLFSRLS